jgi:hypothetical protein
MLARRNESELALLSLSSAIIYVHTMSFFAAGEQRLA